MGEMKRIILAALIVCGMASIDQINPDVTQDTIGQTICQRGWSASVRPPAGFTEPIKRELMRQIGATDPKEFELDHWVPIEVGGCPTCKSNLRLQQWSNPQHHHCDSKIMMDAACKDRLENFVHRQICSGNMTLADGQAIFLGDWVAAYQKQFQ